MSWKNQPATVAQMTTIRDFYERAIGWNNATTVVEAMRQKGITKGEASEEITRLHELKIKGQDTAPLNWW